MLEDSVEQKIDFRKEKNNHNAKYVVADYANFLGKSFCVLLVICVGKYCN